MMWWGSEWRSRGSKSNPSVYTKSYGSSSLLFLTLPLLWNFPRNQRDVCIFTIYYMYIFETCVSLADLIYPPRGVSSWTHFCIFLTGILKSDTYKFLDLLQICLRTKYLRTYMVYYLYIWTSSATLSCFPTRYATWNDRHKHNPYRPSTCINLPGLDELIITESIDGINNILVVHWSFEDFENAYHTILPGLQEGHLSILSP